MGFSLSTMDQWPVDYRLNMSAMACVNELMARTGMAAYGYSRDGAPEPVPLEALFELQDEQGSPKPGLEEAWDSLYARFDEGRVWRPTRGDSSVQSDEPLYGIALHKLRSNDSWVVTDQECSEALVAWGAAVITSVSTGGCVESETDGHGARELASYAQCLLDGAPPATMERFVRAGIQIERPRLPSLAWMYDPVDGWIQFLLKASMRDGFDVR